MPGSATDYLEDAVLDHIFKASAFTAPSPLYFGLYTDSNTATQHDAGTFTEVTGGSYARVSVTPGAAFTASGTAPTQIVNANDIAFPTASASWGTVQGWFIMDAASGGNPLFWAPLDEPKAVPSGELFKLPATTGAVVTCD